MLSCLHVLISIVLQSGISGTSISHITTLETTQAIKSLPRLKNHWRPWIKPKLQGYQFVNNLRRNTP